MDLHVDDDGFVRAPAALVYRRLTDVAAWDAWWPQLDVTPRPDRGPDEVVTFELRPAAGRRLRYDARLHGWRHDAGFSLALEGDVRGHAEFWLEPGWGGTVVHHLLVGATSDPRPAQVLADYRRVLRRGLWACKDRLELEVRTGAGASP